MSRHKARIKYLIHKIGVNEFLKLVEEEKKALFHNVYEIEIKPSVEDFQTKLKNTQILPVLNQHEYQTWLTTNTFKQKQEGYYGVYIKILLGNITSAHANFSSAS